MPRLWLVAAVVALSGCAYSQQTVLLNREPLRKEVASGFAIEVQGLDWITFRDPAGKVFDRCVDFELLGLGFGERPCDMRRGSVETDLLARIVNPFTRLWNSVANLFSSEKKAVPTGYPLLMAAPPGKYLIQGFGYTKSKTTGDTTTTTSATWTYDTEAAMPAIEVKPRAVTLVGFLDVSGDKPRLLTSPKDRKAILASLNYELSEMLSTEELHLRLNWLPAIEVAAKKL